MIAYGLTACQLVFVLAKFAAVSMRPLWCR
jgi:hypothetical protein